MKLGWPSCLHKLNRSQVENELQPNMVECIIGHAQYSGKNNIAHFFYGNRRDIKRSKMYGKWFRISGLYDNNY